MDLNHQDHVEEDNSGQDSNAALLSPAPAIADSGSFSEMECLINPGTANELICQGYRRCLWKSALSLIGLVFSGGFLLLIFYWRPDWKLKCTSSRTSFKLATSVFLKATDETKQVFVSEIQTMPAELAHLVPKNKPSVTSFMNGVSDQEVFTYGTSMYDEPVDVLYFVHHLSKFIWNFKEQTFLELGGLDGNIRLGEIHQSSAEGLCESESEKRKSLFGPNLITVEIPSHIQLLVFEILNPFYIFQLFAVLFWMFDEYYVYATAILVMSIVSAITSLVEIRKERVRLHNMVEYHNETKTKVIRSDGESTEIWSKDLVPGDVIVIPPAGIQLACDAVLVSGTCIVNESMLTGESVPVTKTRLPTGDAEQTQLYDMEMHKRHTLFCGTQVIQTRNYQGEHVKALVARTGYQTAKGQLVHSILYPKPVDMMLLRDAYRFVALLFLIAMSGFIYTVVIQEIAGVSAEDIALNAIDLITISVPPALPLAMTIGIIYAQRRLKRQKIYCISPQRINVSGQVDVVAFDKTGTLTEEGLDLFLIVPVNHKPHTVVSSSPKFRNPVQPGNIVEDLGIDSELLQCLVTCHTLTIIDGKLTGDPLDLKMFEACGWTLKESSEEDESKFDVFDMTYVSPAEQFLKALQKSGATLTDSMELVESPATSNSTDLSSYNIGIARQFPFSSSLQRASVIVKPYRSKPKEFVIFMKGAPEMVAKLCRPESVPPDFHSVLKSYSQQGLRMIGAAFKPFTSTWHKAQKVERTAVESDLIFLGLIALENKLKPQSAGALKKLRDANIRSLMVTGDNSLTALSVARECGLIQPYDVVLMAHTTPLTQTSPATLKWSITEEPPNVNPAGTINSFSSSEEKVVKADNTVAICMGDQLPQTWHLAVSGPSYAVIQENFPDWMEILVTKGTIFARMSPSQKTSLMEELQEVDYHVCMCGDGANDCGALKRSHAGISLSEYEASVAAPFMAKTELGVECVPTLIREGRAALVTSFGMFKFMALYSLIQFCSITILYNKLSNLSDLQYLYIDLIVIDFVALTMSRNHAHKVLDKNHPPSSLMSVDMLASLVMQIVLQLAAQLVVFFLVQDQCWYTDRTPAEAKNHTIGDNATCPQLNHVQDQSEVVDEFNILTYETSSIFLLSAFLYLSVSVAFSRGRPFRTHMFKNRWYVASLVILVLFTLFQVFLSPIEFDNFMQTRQIPDTLFLVIIVCVAAGHFVLSVSFEMLVVEQPKLWKAVRHLCRCFCRNHVSKRYKVLLQDLEQSDYPDDCTVEAGQCSVKNPVHFVDKTLFSNKTFSESFSNKTRL